MWNQFWKSPQSRGSFTKQKLAQTYTAAWSLLCEASCCRPGGPNGPTHMTLWDLLQLHLEWQSWWIVPCTTQAIKGLHRFWYLLHMLLKQFNTSFNTIFIPLKAISTVALLELFKIFLWIANSCLTSWNLQGGRFFMRRYCCGLLNNCIYSYTVQVRVVKRVLQWSNLNISFTSYGRACTTNAEEVRHPWGST